MTEPLSDLASAYNALRTSMNEHIRAIEEAERIRQGVDVQLLAIAEAAYATDEIETVLGAIRALYWQWPDVPSKLVAEAFGVNISSLAALAGGLLSGKDCATCGEPTWFLSATAAKSEQDQCRTCHVQVYQFGQTMPVRRGQRIAGLERITYRMRWPMSDGVESVWSASTQGAP